MALVDSMAVVKKIEPDNGNFMREVWKMLTNKLKHIHENNEVSVCYAEFQNPIKETCLTHQISNKN